MKKSKKLRNLREVTVLLILGLAGDERALIERWSLAAEKQFTNLVSPFLNRAWRRGEKLRCGSVDNLGIVHRKALDLFMYLRALACGKHDRTLGRSSPFYRADGKAGSPQSLASAG